MTGTMTSDSMSRTGRTSLAAEIEALEEYIHKRRDVAAYVLARYPKMSGAFWTQRAEETRRKVDAAVEKLRQLELQRQLMPADPPDSTASNPTLFFAIALNNQGVLHP